jgi:NTE family protein
MKSKEPSSVFNETIDRIQEWYKNLHPDKTIGLALGGGAVLGAAHVGVLRALEEFDLEISYISGTSIGALIGTLYAFGKKPKEIEELMLDLNWLDISKVSLSKYSLFSN